MVNEEILADKFADAVRVSSNGVSFGFTNEFLSEMGSRFAALFGDDFDRTSETAAGRIIEAAMRAMVYAVGYAAGNIGQLNVAYASGRYLQSLAGLYDIEREEGKRTRVTCVLGGRPGAVVLPGLELSDKEYGRLATKDAVTIQPDGQAEVLAEYENAGLSLSYVPSPGDRLNLEASGAAIESAKIVERSGGVIVGANEESDTSLRKKISEQRVSHDSYLVEAVNEIQAMDGVISCFCYENGTYKNVFMTKNKKIELSVPSVEFVQVSAHSMICVVDYDSDVVGEGKSVSEDEVNLKVANVLYRKRSGGCAMTPVFRRAASTDADDHVPVPTITVGGVSQFDEQRYNDCVKNIEIPGIGYVMTFNKVEIKPYNIVISVAKNHYSGSARQLATDIIVALKSWQKGEVEKVDRPTIGRNVYSYEVAAAVSNVIPEILIKEVKLGTSSGFATWTDDTIFPLISQRAYCSLDTLGASPSLVIRIDDAVVLPKDYYTVTFNTDGGSPIPAVQNVIEGWTATQPQVNPSKVGYSFSGWYDSSAAGAAVFDFSTPIEANTTVYAKYNSESPSTVTFYDGTSVLSTDSVQYGGTANRPSPDPTKSGHSFVNWYSDGVFSKLFDFSTKITANTSVYARFEQTVVVTFNADGGVPAPEQKNIPSGGTVSRPETAPAKSGYRFIDWYDAATGGNVFNFGAAITENTTIYARYQQVFTVTFNTDGGSAVTSQTVDSGGYARQPETDPTKSGFVFEGWYTTSSFATQFNFATTAITQNTTVYAKFTTVYLCCTANADGMTVKFEQVGTPHAITLEKSSDAANWSSYTIGSEIALDQGDKVYFRAGSDGNSGFSKDIGNRYTFTATGNGTVSMTGDVTTLLNRSGNVLDLENVSDSVFSGLFYGCTALTTAPSLPSTSLDYRCYYRMFLGCTSLVVAPALPATELGYNCYYEMFNGCSALTTAPDLPAWNLPSNCYYGMFRNCISLTEAPYLPGSIINRMSYNSMFDGCTNLSTVRIRLTTWEDDLGDLATSSWLLGVSNEGTFTCPAALGTQETITRDASHCPPGWTVVNE